MIPEREQRTQTVFLVDDDVSTLCVLELMLSRVGHAVMAFHSPRKFLAQVPPDAPGCLLLDLHMPEMNGLAVQAALRRSGSTLPIVFLSSVARVPDAVEAMKRGAVDFLCTPAPAAAVRAVVAKALERDRVARAARRERETLRARFEELTPQEQQVARLVAQGLLSKQIAGELRVAEQTIRLYRSRLMHKLGVASVAELVRFVEDVDPGARTADGGVLELAQAKPAEAGSPSSLAPAQSTLVEWQRRYANTIL